MEGEYYTRYEQQHEVLGHLPVKKQQFQVPFDRASYLEKTEGKELGEQSVKHIDG